MTEPVHDQLSAFIDDELSEEESAFLVRRLERDTAARERLIRYSIIGAALRGELLQPDPLILRRRIQAALDGAPKAALPAQPAARAARLAPLRNRRLVRPLAGAGIAATVAVAAIGLLRYTGDTGADGTVTAPAGALTASQWREPESYVVPAQDATPRERRELPIRLTNYLVQHGQYASHLNRTAVHSNVISVNHTEMPAAPEPVIDLEEEPVQ
ncbi:MAG TPA: sigma-E factor negative regulatory protein [Gammaproteobacteria bacterium]